MLKQSYTLLICSSKTDFLKSSCAASLSLNTPTVEELLASQKIELFFAPTILHVQVFLSTGKLPETASEKHATSSSMSLVIINYLSQHIHEGSQGLARIVAMAVEVTYLAGTNLLFAECTGTGLRDLQARLDGNPWDTSMSVLAAAPSTSATRPWASRTVLASNVIAQWCEPIELRGHAPHSSRDTDT